MTGNEIRQQFLRYFAENGHTVVDGSPLVPQADPTLLFTNAGMVQFKRVFMGEEKREYVRAVTCQRCIRAGGKHNDLENVGYTARHHTFFEMLGNFSFGDYFKEEAIRFGWDFLTKIIGLPPERLWVSVFKDDDEAYRIWEGINDLLPGRIVRLGEKDNFWAMGDTGPCGPCSEIHIDQGPEVGCGRSDCGIDCDCDRFLEIWNLVFMQFYRDESGALTRLPKPSIDTGMGLERVAAVAQGKTSNYDSDIFAGLIERIARVAGRRFGADPRADTAMRVIADHSRATAFLVADGVFPSNEGRGYVLRRIMRRAVRYGRLLGLTKPFMSEITEAVVEQMAGVYPHLRDAAGLLAKVVRKEEERFIETIDNGLAMLSEEIGRLRKAGAKGISGECIFKLYDTFGFPVDIVKDIAAEEGLVADEAGFNAAMAKQRAQSKKSWKGAGIEVLSPAVRELLFACGKSRFVGYDTRRHSSTIAALLEESGKVVEEVVAGGQIAVICPETPFYAECGGQIGDHGEIVGPAGRAQVFDTILAGEGVVLHKAEVLEGILHKGDVVELKVAEGRRQRIANNHTATHLLQAALRAVLGEHVKQSGSLVEDARLRFDFTHFSPMTSEEIARVEMLVNDEIRANTGLSTEILARDEAVRRGATALFGEKYGETVRVVGIGEFSMELCGGTHTGATGEIGLCRIVSEIGIAAGVRRLEAITGPEAFARFQQVEATLGNLAGQLKTQPEEIEQKLDKLLVRQKELEKEVSMLTARLSMANIDEMLAAATMIDGVRFVSLRIELDSAKTLREIGDRVRDKLGSGVAVLGGVLEGKAALLVIVSKDLTRKFHAGNIVKEVAAIVGGSGGGRPDMAQAGGPLVDKLSEALSAAREIIKRQIA